MFHNSESFSYRFTIHTDASGSWGCRVFMSGQWLQWEWPNTRVLQGIMAKELVFSCAKCGAQQAKQSVLIL